MTNAERLKILDRIERLAGKAIQRPWARGMNKGCRSLMTRYKRRQGGEFACTSGLADDSQDAANADLIVALANSLEWLLPAAKMGVQAAMLLSKEPTAEPGEHGVDD